MSFLHILYALIVAFIWGINFIAIKLAYQSFTPYALLTYRFILATFPLIFFVPKPQSDWKYLFLIALFLWVGQFSFTFMGIYLGAPAGLSSLLMQGQTIFTVILLIIWSEYKPYPGEIVGITIAALGIIAITIDRFDGGNIIGILTIIPSGACISIANVLINKNQNNNDSPISIIVWSGLLAIPIMALLSIYFEGPQAMIEPWHKINAVSAMSVAYTVYLSTIIATSIWAFLMKKYIPSLVVPYSLLVPIFGMLGSYAFLQENYSNNTLLSCIVVMIGLLINQKYRKPSN